MENRFNVYDLVNNTIIQKLEEGIIPWYQTWTKGVPLNFVSKRMYNGTNFLLLSNQNFPTPYYLTFFQCKNKGGSIIKGSKSLPVVFWKIIDYPEQDDPNNVYSFPLLRYTRVFNLSQTTLYKPDESEKNSLLINAENIITNMNEKPVIKNNFTSCYYSLKNDFISVPLPKYFNSIDEYYSSLFHELIHWTGSPKRLRRFDKYNKDKHSYSFEELVAEIGSAYLCALTGIKNDKLITNQAAYIQGWLKKLKNDNKFIIKAASKAQRAVDFILGNSN